MDFKWKNGQLFQKFSEMTGKSGVASMEIIADGTQANENPAAAYRGLGCISANNASRLLLDYKVEHPKEYEEIMRLLFQKDYGIGLRMSILLAEQNRQPSEPPKNGQM